MLLSARNMLQVAVEGNIGCGKSTFLKFFQQFPSVTALQEPVDQWTKVGGKHNALGLLYENPSRWNFMFNQYAMLSRIKQHKQAVNCPVKMMERSLFSTQHVFIENSYKSGFLTDLEHDILTEWFSYLVSSDNVHIDLFVYLRVSPDICFQRIRNRGRPEESNISLDFLTKLHELHEELVVRGNGNDKLPAPILILNAELELDEMYQIYADKKAEILRGYA